MNFLYEDLDSRRKLGNIASIPDYVIKNLKPTFELRPYQSSAFENFITYFESGQRPYPLQVLFHMATGSGKTLIMAGLILYLYKQGYRNFLFFVNLSNIVEKTKENFLNPGSSKYLFADEVVIDGEIVKINQVENFQNAREEAINICFTTTQGLHLDIWFAKENGMTLEDFKEQKIVLISDESHHLNVATKKKLSPEEKQEVHSWEETVKFILKENRDNVLLEFTATCDLGNPNILAAYKDKVIFNYPLKSFYDERYSKDIFTFRSNLGVAERVLQAMVLSQYRLKVFQDHRLWVKPVILFKSRTVGESEAFIMSFHRIVGNLNGKQLQALRKASSDNVIMSRVFEYFEAKSITLDMLASELRDDFSDSHCISANESKFEADKQIILNSLEDKDNPYRAIFEVKKLDEGWDVLNLFDIVRLYEVKQPKGKGILSSTISEAQLIGRGARYFPFRVDDEQSKFQRKYDNDITNEMRACETLYYHCQNDNNYVLNLKRALHEIGLDAVDLTTLKYVLKKEFTEAEIYKNGLIFLNDRERIAREEINGLPPKVRDALYGFNISSSSGLDVLMADKPSIEDSGIKVTVSKTIKEIASINYAIVNKALMKNPDYKFNNLKKFFPNVTSTRMFITDDKYLGSVRINLSSKDEQLPVQALHAAVSYVLNKIASLIFKTEETYRGTKKFRARKVREIFHDKTVKYTELHAGGLGKSQNDSSVDKDHRLDLSEKKWYAYTDNYGTSEEKAFVAFFEKYVKDLEETYQVYLVRNEREFHIYSFDDGNRFEPDYVLFLKKAKEKGFEQMQIFIEPKGDHLLKQDAWKEEFLLRLKEEAIPVKVFRDDNDYKIWGFHFFNKSDNESGSHKFMSDFVTLIER